MTPINIISTSVVGNVLDTGEVATDAFMRDVTMGAEDDPQITVVLNGVIYDAVVSGNSLKEEGEWAQAARANLPDGDYTVTADVSDSAGSCLLASSVSNDIVASLILKRYLEGDLPNGRLSLSVSAAPNLPKHTDGQYLDDSLAEPGITWVTHSTRNQSSTNSRVTIRNSIGRITVPSDLVLTPRVLVSALGKLPTHQVEEVVGVLIDILDYRYGDPDLEIDADSETDDG